MPNDVTRDRSSPHLLARLDDDAERAPHSPSRPNYDRYLATLRSLDQEVIPRLVQRIGAEEREARAVGTDAEVGWTARTLMAGETQLAVERARQLMDFDWSIDQIYIDLLGGTARYLGNLWVQDEAGFAEVTIAACRLRDMMEELTPDFHAENPGFVTYRGRLLLSPVSGEQHTLGAQMAAAFFSRAGWDVLYADGADENRFENALDGQDIGLIGFSVASLVKLDALREDIITVRQTLAAHGKKVPILVGGALITEQPHHAIECGADGFAMDAAHALIVAEGFLPSFTSG